MWSSLLLGISATSLTLLYFVVRHLHSPLRHVPGPKLAPFTRIWLFLNDIGGSGAANILKLHQEYGPVIRIAPNEISICDSEEYLGVLYTQGTKFLKEPNFYKAFSSGPDNLFSTSDTRLHSKIRRLMSNGFSEKAVLIYKDTISKRLDRLYTLILDKSSRKAPLNLPDVFRSLTLDVITKFMYGESMGALDHPELEDPLLAVMEKTAFVPTLFAQFPALKTPFQFFAGLLPGETSKAVKALVDRVINSIDKIDDDIKFEEDGHQAMFSNMKKQAKIQNVEISKDTLVSEGVSNIFAGTDTTAATLSVTLWSVFNDPEVYKKLHFELRTLMPEKITTPNYNDLRALPYLNACIKEGLRIATPIRGRLPRVVPSQGWTYKSYHFPAGTIVSSSATFLHQDPEKFPNPQKFDPERWLTSDKATIQQRERLLVPFSKGSRQCIGQNLAWMELRLCIALIGRRFKAEVIDQGYKVQEHFALVFETPLRVNFQQVED